MKLRRLSIIYVGSKTKSGLPLVVLYNFRYRYVDYCSNFWNLVNFPSDNFKPFSSTSDKRTFYLFTFEICLECFCDYYDSVNFGIKRIRNDFMI